MKTNREYLQLLTEEEKEKYLKNLETLGGFIHGGKNFLDDPSLRLITFQGFLRCSFDLFKCPEGFQYWNSIMDRIYNS